VYCVSMDLKRKEKISKVGSKGEAAGVNARTGRVPISWTLEMRRRRERPGSAEARGYWAWWAGHARRK
jgi:hypothetical protein